ncbi:MAG TPA: cell division protein ZapD [Thioalkalivibrio sp.]|nr:cell division protein ZapD [Thioalkalivibrio sp.]
MSETITYEQPLNERLRTLLRLEALMARFDYCLPLDSHWDTHCALVTLMEIFQLSTRGDLKSDLMKELDREIGNLSRLSREPDVDQVQLDGIIDRQRQQIKKLRGMTGQLGQHLKDNDFVNALRQRSSIPGGTCDFDLPAYHHWLSRPVEVRRRQFEQWIAPFREVQEAIDLVLSLIRNSTTAHAELARMGFYQQNLDLSQPYQMIRVELPANVSWFPEISAGKHRFTIRFLSQPDLDNRARQLQQDIEFRLACCAL